jgi:FKBP-type peptidyl-prolyl cis-trans isomerase
MRPGGERRLVVPPELAFGTAGYPGEVPAGATLVFRVELLEVRARP